MTCYGFQPGCTFETNGKCPMVDIPVANLAITAKAGVGGALILQNAVSNKYNRVINREGLNSLQALMRRPSNGTPVAITKTTTMKTILGWVQSGVCSLDVTPDRLLRNSKLLHPTNCVSLYSRHRTEHSLSR